MISRILHRTILWKPDESVPYMIHSKGHFLDNMVIIWPKVIRVPYDDEARAADEYLSYMTNREHIFLGTLKQRPTNAEVDFYQRDGIGSPAWLHIAPLTDEEFSIIQALYKKQFNRSICSREDLVQDFIKCFDP